MTSQYLPPDAQAETVAAPVEPALVACPNPWCRGVGPQVFHVRNGLLAVICGCDFHGPECDTRAAAIAAWNRRTPDPLLVQALEALRGMVGGTCPDCKGWGEVAYFGEMVRCKCNGDYRHQPGAASRATAAAILAQAKERGL